MQYKDHSLYKKCSFFKRKEKQRLMFVIESVLCCKEHSIAKKVCSTHVPSYCEQIIAQMLRTTSRDRISYLHSYVWLLVVFFYCRIQPLYRLSIYRTLHICVFLQSIQTFTNFLDFRSRVFRKYRILSVRSSGILGGT